MTETTNIVNQNNQNIEPYFSMSLKRESKDDQKFEDSSFSYAMGYTVDFLAP